MGTQSNRHRLCSYRQPPQPKQKSRQNIVRPRLCTSCLDRVFQKPVQYSNYHSVCRAPRSATSVHMTKMSTMEYLASDKERHSDPKQQTCHIPGKRCTEPAPIKKVHAIKVVTNNSTKLNNANLVRVIKSSINQGRQRRFYRPKS